jgi:hypothetical protein
MCQATDDASASHHFDSEFVSSGSVKPGNAQIEQIPHQQRFQTEKPPNAEK